MTFANKTDLEKKNGKILRSYSKHFNLREPYKIIIGPYFCQSVAEKHVSLSDGIKSVFLDRNIEIYTTRCCINELQKLIDKKQLNFICGAHILRTLKLLPCLHKSNNNNNNRWKCINSINCIQSYINKKEYCFALQPRSYLGRVRNKIGIPSIWMYESQMILDKLSKTTQIFMKNNQNKQIGSDIKNFIQDDDDSDSQFDDEQNNINNNNNNNDFKQNKMISNKKSKRNSNNNYKIKRNRIRYGPDGGFDTMGMFMPKKKKRRTKRGNKQKKNNKYDNLNDNHFETTDDVKHDVMSINKSQKQMSNWWKK